MEIVVDKDDFAIGDSVSTCSGKTGEEEDRDLPTVVSLKGTS